MKRPLHFLPILLLASCATMKSVGDKAGAGVARLGERVGEGFGKVAEVTTAPFGPGVPVVEAREDALVELPSGRDKAVAYQQAQRRRSFPFFGAVDFEEPSLPEDAGAAAAGLLPPKVE